MWSGKIDKDPPQSNLTMSKVQFSLLYLDAFKQIHHIQKWPIHRRSSCFLFQIEF